MRSHLLFVCQRKTCLVERLHKEGWRGGGPELQRDPGARKWEDFLALFDINTQGAFEGDEEWAVRIQGRGETGAKLYVDDISISSGPCPPPGNCDFEDGLGCGWIQDTHDDLDWLVLQADFLANLGGPIYDHSQMAFDGILQSILGVFHHYLQDILPL